MKIRAFIPALSAAFALAGAVMAAQPSKTAPAAAAPKPVSVYHQETTKS